MPYGNMPYKKGQKKPSTKQPNRTTKPGKPGKKKTTKKPARRPTKKGKMGY